MKNKKILSSISILFMITIFVVMVFSFGMTSFQKEKVSIYNSELVASDNNSFVEESGWTLEQISTSSEEGAVSNIEGFGNSSIIGTNPEGNDFAFVWGSNYKGQLGNGKAGQGLWSGKPGLIEFDMTYSDIKFLLVEDNSAMAVLTDERGNDFLYTWGNNMRGQLGIGKTDSAVTEPKQVDLEEATGTTDYKIKSISIGSSATYIVLTMDGKDSVWSAGYDYNGQLGTVGGNTNLYTQVIFPSNDNVKEIISSDFGEASKVAVLTDDGESILYTWGKNANSQQNPSSNETLDEELPVMYTGFPDEAKIDDKKIKQVSTDNLSHTTMVVLTDNEGNDELWTWGDNDFGQQGYDSLNTIQRTPKLVTFPDPYSEIKDINSSSVTSSAITVDSEGKEHLYLWGENADSTFGASNNDEADTELGEGKNTPFEMKPKYPIYDEYTYTIKEVSLSNSYQAVIVDYRGSTQLYMWGIAYQGSMGPGTYDPNDEGTNYIPEIGVVRQTPMITFDNGPPSVISDKDKGKMLSFTLDWDPNTVTPANLNIIDSDGELLISNVSLSELNPGAKIEMNIEGVIPEGVENVRFEILNDEDKTLVISQSFNIDKSLLDTFDDNSAKYNWFTAKKKLSFTLNYPSSISLASVQVIDVGTNESIDIKIDPGDVINGVEYKMDISDFENESKLYVYISAEFTNGHIIESEDFYIPSTKIPGWIISLVALITIITITIIIVIVLIILRAKASYNREHKMAKMKRAYR